MALTVNKPHKMAINRISSLHDFYKLLTTPGDKKLSQTQKNGQKHY